jgi:hypothetical protein
VGDPPNPATFPEKLSNWTILVRGLAEPASVRPLQSLALEFLTALNSIAE